MIRESVQRRKVSRKILRLLMPHNVTGAIMIIASFFIASRSSSVVAQEMLSQTDGYLNVYGVGILFFFCGLYLVFRRPRPNAFWYLVATSPILLYAAFVVSSTFFDPHASVGSTIFTLGFWTYGIATALWLDNIRF